ncbi:MAG: CDP-diacylglycerol--glycerol-3-phosphate 3-phosphatidyltransferase [Candidatus Methylacidiphilales bacterium]|nr:CDP-diacylglycerol--glycerol-3-phosphate 3-phosphatidyltransferase [Candidatus Methylacidiphilales bacterium]
MRTLNIANQLTIARLVMCAFFVASMSVTWEYSAVTALILFILASITDWLDGEVARKYDLITDLGKLLDPLADKVLISAALIALIERGMAPMWMVVAIITREFLVTGLRTVAANKRVILPAEKAGKYKTVAQIVAISASLTLLALKELHLAESAPAHLLALATPTLYWVALLITVVSGALYFHKNASLFDAEAMNQNSDKLPAPTAEQAARVEAVPNRTSLAVGVSVPAAVAKAKVSTGKTGLSPSV